MLQIRHLTISHKKDLHLLLEDFNLTLNPGDKAVLIGEEGNGKSTLLKWIRDPALVEAYTEAEGERILPGERLGYLPQELPAEEQEKSVAEYLSAKAEPRTCSPKDLANLTAQLGLPEGFPASTQRLGTLSGGEKIKTQLLALLLTDPTVLLLDEPSNDLDLKTLEWLENFIRKTDKTVLFISHDETLIEKTANVVIHLEQLRKKSRPRYTVARIPYREYVARREGAFRRQAQEAESERREKRARDEKFRRIHDSVEAAQANITRQDPATGRLLKKKMHTVKSLERRFAREDEDMTEFPEQEEAIFFKFDAARSAMPAGKTVLNLDLKELKNPEGRLLARDVKLYVRGPEKIGIVGKNGVGKSTLLKEIAAQLLAKADLNAAYMPQNYGDSLDGSLPPLEFLCPLGDRAEQTRIRTYLGAMRYTTDEMEHPMAELSGGQRAKLLLLKMSLSGANVLLLDEPTRNFSPLSGPVIRRLLAEYPGTVISVSHDRKFLAEVCTKVLELTPGGTVPIGIDGLGML